MKSKKEQQVDEILMDYAKIIEKAQAAEMDKNYTSNPDFDFEASLKELKDSGLFKPEKKRSSKKILQLAAMVLLAICVTVAALPTTEVHAWAIWTFNAIFGGDETHTIINPSDENDYIRFYVDEILDGFQIKSQRNTEGRERIVYTNQDEEYITFQQIRKDVYLSDVDAEHMDGHYERIGNFEVLVSEGENDWLFTIISDGIDTVVMVHTDAGYEVGKQFMENLVYG